MSHTVKAFSIVNEAEVDVFLEFFCFFYDLVNVSSLISRSSTFSKSSLYMWKFLVHVPLKPSLKIFELYLANVWNENNCAIVWTFFDIVFLWDWNDNWPFPVLWPLLSFPNLLAYWVQHLNSIIFFRIRNSSAGIPSPPQFLFIVMLPKAHLTSHSRMSGSRWVTTPLWLSGSLRAFLYSSFVYSCHLLWGFFCFIFKNLFIYFNWRLITLQYCSGFAIHWHGSIMGIQVSLIVNHCSSPSPSHPAGSSQCTGPERPVSCTEPGLMIYFTYGNIHVSMLFFQKACLRQLHISIRQGGISWYCHKNIEKPASISNITSLWSKTFFSDSNQNEIME